MNTDDWKNDDKLTTQASEFPMDVRLLLSARCKNCRQHWSSTIARDDVTSVESVVNEIKTEQKMLILKGWTVVKGKVFCPECKGKHKAC